MNINFKWGYYTRAGLCEITADLNVSQDYYRELKELLKVKRVKDGDLIRVGLGGADGGYIMLKSFKDNGIAYSFGISNDVTWDNIMAEMGYDIYQYDHTINALPYERKEFHFFKEGISGIDSEEQPLKTLEYYLNRNKHLEEKNMILKMDVEGAEWDFLETVDSSILKQFDQIVFEMHNMVRPVDANRILPLLKKLNNTHSLVHIHGNNCGYQLKIGDTIFPDVIETTYINKEKYETVEDDSLIFPTPLDSPNDRGRVDINLGQWNKPLKI